MVHRLKTAPKFWTDAWDGSKRFTVRKHDRPFGEGDIIEKVNIKTLEILTFKIKYVLTHEDFPDGLQPGYCVLGLEDV